jgi:hypothetical protein
MPIRTTEDALQLLGERGVMALTRQPPLRSLVEEVAGAPVPGSWWAHARGGDIYRIANELEDHPEVLIAKLVAGKVTFVHARLWPALYRVVGDAGWRADAEARAGMVARRLLTAVVAASPLRFDDHVALAPAADRPALRKAKDELDKGMLARAAQIHTTSGRHATVLSTWASWASPAVVAAAAQLELEAARREIADAVGGLPTPLTEAPRRPGASASRASAPRRPARRR